MSNRKIAETPPPVTVNDFDRRVILAALSDAIDYRDDVNYVCSECKRNDELIGWSPYTAPCPTHRTDQLIASLYRDVFGRLKHEGGQT